MTSVAQKIYLKGRERELGFIWLRRGHNDELW
jgi:hypothetical protein